MPTFQGKEYSTLENLVESNPEAALRHLARMQMYTEALEASVKKWAEKNGEFVSKNKSVKYQRRTREYVKLDSEKAGDVLESQGFDLLDIAEVKLTEESIKAKLGEVDGNKVIAELVAAGAIKVNKITYWRLQVK